jgi:hypothetical protein
MRERSDEVWSAESEIRERVEWARSKRDVCRAAKKSRLCISVRRTSAEERDDEEGLLGLMNWRARREKSIT